MKKIDRRLFKGTNIFSLVFTSIKLEIGEMKDYIEDTARTLNRRQQDLERKYDEAKLTVEEDDPWFDMHFQDEFTRLHKLFPSYTYNSLLVNQYSFIERWLKKLCELHQNRTLPKIKLSDLFGSDVDKCKKYLVIVAEIEFASFETEWKRIKFVEQLRHNIVHNASHIPKNDKYENLINHIKLEKYVKYDEDHRDFFIENHTFLLDFDRIILSFFEKLTDALSAKRVLARNSKMRYNNDVWGQEKSEAIIADIIACKRIVKNLADSGGTDQRQLSFLTNTLYSMANNSTKLLAFFHDGEWKVEDANLIFEDGKEGLEHLVKAYK